MMWNQSTSSDVVDWDNFSLPEGICNKVKRVGPSFCRMDWIIAKAKSLLTKRSTWCYLGYYSNSDFLDQEIIIAKELAQIWQKKYNRQKKKQQVINQIEKEQAIQKAFKDSKHKKSNRLSKKQMYKRAKKWKSSKKKKETKKDLEDSCKLCFGSGKLTTKNKSYPCPACGEVSEKPRKKKTPLKDQPKLGERKLRF